MHLMWNCVLPGGEGSFLTGRVSLTFLYPWGEKGSAVSSLSHSSDGLPSFLTAWRASWLGPRRTSIASRWGIFCLCIDFLFHSPLDSECVRVVFVVCLTVTFFFGLAVDFFNLQAFYFYLFLLYVAKLAVLSAIRQTQRHQLVCFPNNPRYGCRVGVVFISVLWCMRRRSKTNLACCVVWRRDVTRGGTLMKAKWNIMTARPDGLVSALLLLRRAVSST